MDFYKLISENDTVLHHGKEVPALVTSGIGDNGDVIDRLEVATFNERGEYIGSLMIYDNDEAESKIIENEISRPSSTYTKPDSLKH